jgi:hypothetical protein
MTQNRKTPFIQPNRLWMISLVSCIVLLATACGSAIVPPANPPAVQPVAAVPTQATAAATEVPTQVSAPAAAPADTAEACTLLPKDDVSKVLGEPVVTAESSGLGGVCTYTTASYKIDFTIAGHTGGIKSMNTTRSRLAEAAQDVPGLGDQAFFNTNSAALFVLKGDALYLFNVNDVNFLPLDPAVVQTTEKALAEKLLGNLS